MDMRVHEGNSTSNKLHICTSDIMCNVYCIFDTDKAKNCNNLEEMVAYNPCRSDSMSAIYSNLSGKDYWTPCILTCSDSAEVSEPEASLLTKARLAGPFFKKV